MISWTIVLTSQNGICINTYDDGSLLFIRISKTMAVMGKLYWQKPPTTPGKPNCQNAECRTLKITMLKLPNYHIRDKDSSSDLNVLFTECRYIS